MPVRILGMGQAHSLGTISNEFHFDTLPAARCGPRALAQAGIRAQDIDVAMLYDCFTIVVLMQLEAYGFCKPGESGDFVAGGRIAPGGALAVNPSGGLLAEAYGGGMLHVIEAVRQLRGTAGLRQVRDASLLVLQFF